MRLKSLAGLTLALTCFALTGCGTSAPATNASGTGAAAAAESASGPITVTDYQGKDITLPGVAKRVVTLEWRETEEVVSLGVQPVGASDLKGYKSWNTSAPITGEIVDVGIRREPSLESIAKAKPDLIIGSARSVPDAALAQMQKIAPVLLLESADATQPIEKTKTNFELIAKTLGKEAEAAKEWKAFEDTVAANTAKVKPGTIYTIVSATATGSTVDFRMHSDRSLAGAVAKQMGLVNAWKEPGDDAFGIGSLDLEGISKLPPETTMLTWANSDEEDVVKTVLGKNALWNSLPMVKENRVKAAANGVWLYGGPRSMILWSNELVKQLNG